MTPQKPILPTHCQLLGKYLAGRIIEALKRADQFPDPGADLGDESGKTGAPIKERKSV
jgi:hypothetical protein